MIFKIVKIRELYIEKLLRSQNPQPNVTKKSLYYGAQEFIETEERTNMYDLVCQGSVVAIQISTDSIYNYHLFHVE